MALGKRSLNYQWLSQVFIGWFFFLAINLIFNIACKNTLVHFIGIPLLLKVSYFAKASVYTLLFAALVALCFIPRFIKVTDNKKLALTISVIGKLLAFVLITFFFLSWGFYSHSAQFLGIVPLQSIGTESFAHFLSLGHIEPAEWNSIIIAAIATTVVLGSFFPWLLESRPYETRQTLCLYSILLIIAMLFIGNLIGLENTIDLSREKIDVSKVKQALSHKTTPLMFLQSDIKTTLLINRLASLPKGKLELTRRPVISMKNYFKGYNAKTHKRPNIIVILMSSLNAKMLKSFGGEQSVMPNLDKLAMQSTRFTNAYTQSSQLHYASLGIMNSRYPMYSLNTYYYPIATTYPKVSLPYLLTHIGYQTALISSQNEYWGGMLRTFRPTAFHKIIHTEVTEEGKLYKDGLANQKPEYLKRMLGPYKVGKVDDAVTTDMAIDFIKKTDKHTPVMLMMTLKNSSYPFRYPRRPKDNPKATIMKKLEKLKRDHRKSLQFVDVQIGKLLKALKATHRFDNSIIIVSGETGINFDNTNALERPSALSQAVIHLPLIIYRSGAKASVKTEPAMQLDVPPTVLALLGLKPHPSFEGVNLYAKDFNLNRAMYFVTQTQSAYEYAIIKKGYKFVINALTKINKLFNLSDDPNETMNLATREPKISRAYHQQLLGFISAHVDYYQTPALHDHDYPPRYKGINR